MTVKVRVVAGDVDQADAVALAVAQILTVTRRSQPRPRRSGDGVSIYLDVELPAIEGTCGHRADPSGRPHPSA
jgi:hypothetical protein